jgi:hypothetical protein
VPTFALTDRFKRDWASLTPEQQKAFKSAVGHFKDDLDAERPFRSGLRVKRVQKTRNVWEMTWAPDGRATWQYGDEQRANMPHIIWRRIGTHDVFGAP